MMCSGLSAIDWGQVIGAGTMAARDIYTISQPGVIAEYDEYGRVKRIVTQAPGMPVPYQQTQVGGNLIGGLGTTGGVVAGIGMGTIAIIGIGGLVLMMMGRK